MLVKKFTSVRQSKRSASDRPGSGSAQLGPGRRARCSATIPPVRSRQPTCDHPDSCSMPASDRWSGQLRIAHEVLDVDGAEGSPRRVAELTDHQSPARARHPQQLTHAGTGVMQVAQPERDRGGIEARVRERQAQPVARDEGEKWPLPLPDAQHPQREVAGDHRRPGRGERFGRCTRSGCQVQDPLPRLRGERGHDLAPPTTVLSERQHVVGEVVTLCDVVEHLRHIAGEFVQICSCHDTQSPASMDLCGRLGSPRGMGRLPSEHTVGLLMKRMTRQRSQLHAGGTSPWFYVALWLSWS
jgi:hypothetical protein